MIENATVHVNEVVYKTRLHEHGQEPLTDSALYKRSEWRFTGYMEGKESWLKALKDKGDRILKFWVDGKLESTKIGVHYGEIVNMYDDHWIMHLDWSSEDDGSGRVALD